MTVAGFRAIFPEFASVDAYPDARVSFALNEASVRLLPGVWGELLESGLAYYAAHRLALSSVLVKAPGAGAATATPLAPPGIVTSKAVGGVSKSMDVSIGSVDGAGDFNLTTYGRQFASLAATVAVGAMQF